MSSLSGRIRLRALDILFFFGLSKHIILISSPEHTKQELLSRYDLKSFVSSGVNPSSLCVRAHHCNCAL